MTTTPSSTAIATSNRPTEYRWLFIPGAIMIVAFFLPWIDVLGRLGLSGYQIATASGELADRSAWTPAIAGLAIIVSTFLSNRAVRRAGLLGGLAIVLPVGYQVGALLLHVTSYGLWLVVAGAIALLVASLSEKPLTRLLGGALIVAGFFLPWLVSRGTITHGQTFSAFEIARTTSELDLDGYGPSAIWFWVLPAAGVAGLASGILGARGRFLSATGGLATLAVIGYVFVTSMNMFVGWGAWLTVAAGFAALGIALRPAR
jgi:hypothetical protein